MPVVHTGESEYDKELAKWNKPYRFEMFPQMLYKAIKKPNGKVVCMEPPPARVGYATDADYLAAVAQADALQRDCHCIVRNEEERRGAFAQGWRDSPTAALAAFEQHEHAVGDAAAEVAYAVRRMSAKAQAEHAAAEAATHEHVTDVTPPAKKRSSHRKRVRVVSEPAAP
jgi:hypothetical protein